MGLRLDDASAVAPLAPAKPPCWFGFRRFVSPHQELVYNLGDCGPVIWALTVEKGDLKA